LRHVRPHQISYSIAGFGEARNRGKGIKTDQRKRGKWRERGEEGGRKRRTGRKGSEEKGNVTHSSSATTTGGIFFEGTWES